jgi:hypothetical protein
MTQLAACTAPPALNEADLVTALMIYGKENAAVVARNPKLLKATMDLLLAVAQPERLGRASALAGGAATFSEAGGASRNVQMATGFTSAGIDTFQTTMEMLNVFKLGSSGAVLAYVGAAAVKKTGLLVSLAGGDSERAKCVGAAMELGGNVAMLALVPATATTGVLLVLQAASLTAAVMSVTQSCFPDALP